MKSAVTVALDPCFAAGPFVFHDDRLTTAVGHARRLGFDAVELFPAQAYSGGGQDEIRELLDDNGLAVSAVGTGAGWVKHKLSLTSPDPAVRQRAKEFIRELAEFAQGFDAPVIIGSMQGRWGDGVSREQALDWLGEGLAEVPGPLLIEPLNRYESNLLNTLADAAGLVMGYELAGARLLADLFHMNIEEADLPSAIRAARGHVGHVHLADSNRRAAGLGHTDFGPVVAALRDIGYAGYLSAECLPYPDPVAAAEQTMATFRRL